MTPDELSRYAYQGAKPEEGLSDQDELLYWRLYEIYLKLKQNKITVEQGKQMKELEVVKYHAKQLRAKRINEILKLYAGATERNDDGEVILNG